MIKTAPSVRVTTSDTLSASDLNGYVLYNGSTAATFDLSTLSSSASTGDVITFADSSSSTISIHSNDVATNQQLTQQGQGGGFTVVYDGTEWHIVNAF